MREQNRTAHRVLLVLTLCAAPASSQIFVDAAGSYPGAGQANNSSTDNVDLADVDLDGDWDAAFADGAENVNDQNRLWINMGGLQGGSLGVFVDRTDTQFPAITDASRDVEFADIDGDGDADLFVGNESQLTNQSSRFWINQGGAEGGGAGYYVDETQSRWVGLGGPGSSVPGALILPSGGFVDWTSDGDFGDLDNDGDLDLVLGGGSFTSTPPRVFLNDGGGFFSEFNPSGFQLSSINISEGDPALWAEGTQLSSSTDTTGLFSDIISEATDFELGDLDGDLDLDLIVGDRAGNVRAFSNRLEETGTLGFRDVSHLVFPPGWGAGGSYDQELGDADGDDDLDLFGLGWGGFSDVMYRNDGTGVFGDETVLPGPASSSEEVDFLDYDRDGDLDAYVASFSGTNRLYRNDDTGSGPWNFRLVDLAETGLGFTGDITKDAEAVDVDGDGDTDVLTGMGVSANPNRLADNVLDVSDSMAPRLARLEVLADAAASPEPRSVRVQVYDNESYYVTWYHEAALEVAVDGCRLPDLGLHSSRGQIFRGVLPGNLTGQVSYTARVTDRYGNSGVSATVDYQSTAPAGASSAFGTGSPGSLGEPALAALSVAFPGTTLFVGGSAAPASTLWFLTLNSAPLPTPVVLPGLLMLNVGGTQYSLFSGVTDAAGCGVVGVPLTPSVPSGIRIYFQWFTLDGTGGDLMASSKGLEVQLQ